MNGIIVLCILIVITVFVLWYITYTRSQSGYRNGWIPLSYGYTLPPGLSEEERIKLEKRYDKKAQQFFSLPKI